MPTLYLIDGSALVYRTHFAFSRVALTSTSGQPIGATYGVALFLHSLLNRKDLDAAACVFDTKEPTFRHEIYPEYKATRQKMPDELAAQLDGIKEMTRVMGFEVLEREGYEADDHEVALELVDKDLMLAYVDLARAFVRAAITNDTAPLQRAIQYI